MKKTTKRIVIATVLALILIVVITSTVFAAEGNPDKGNQGEACPYGECTNGECTNDDCVPNDYSHDWNYSYQTPGPHGAQNGKTAE